MPWKEKDKSTMRKESIELVLSGQRTKASVCRQFNISRPTLDMWIARYQAGESLLDRAHTPYNTPNKTPAETELAIVQYRVKYPAIGAVKLRQLMLNDGYENLPCTKTFNNILHRNGLISKQASQAATPHIRFQREAPNEMWQGDFKGHFALGNGGRCHPLNITDDCSRFNLCSVGLENETFKAVQPVFENVFREYGMPESFLCDNGNPWGTVQSTGYTRFEVWLMELGILTIHGRFLHPQTQGKMERFNGSLKREYLNYHTFNTMAEAQQGLDEYRAFYNERRPHHALDLETPSSRYEPSFRQFPDKIIPWEYGPEYTVHRVKDNGYFVHRGQGYFLSEAFAGKEIAVRDSLLQGQLTLVFRDFRVGRIDPDKRVFTLRKCSRLHDDV